MPLHIPIIFFSLFIGVIGNLFAHAALRTVEQPPGCRTPMASVRRQVLQGPFARRYWVGVAMRGVTCVGLVVAGCVRCLA